MTTRYRTRRLVGVLLALLVTAITLVSNPQLYQQVAPATTSPVVSTSPALETLATLPVKGRAPKTDYSRTQFGSGWTIEQGCDTRNIILHRDLQQPSVGEDCKVLSGSLSDPYTGNTLTFQRGADTSQLVQIDHVVALSNAWQTGAQQLTPLVREQLANDPLNLLTVDGKTNQNKSDGDAATWLPPNKLFRCQYVARQVAVKKKYSLWVTTAEKAAIAQVLGNCPAQAIPQ
jgi:hypothetical protein